MTSDKRILLVEDSERDVEMALAALDEHGFGNNIDVARDGAEALDYLYRRGPYAERPWGNPVLVLLDLKMPKVNGLEVLQQMKADPVMKVIPVVMMTSSREQKDLRASYHLGVNAYVVKPVTLAGFLEAVGGLGQFWGRINEPPPDGGASDPT